MSGPYGFGHKKAIEENNGEGKDRGKTKES
jgi:hypothetical protein